MVYATGIGSPATTEFFRRIGANEFHFGLIAGLPMLMLLFQFLGAAVNNRARRRKPTFVALLIGCRLLYLLIAFLPLALPGRVGPAMMLAMIGMMALSSAMNNYATPFWFSWMADVVPRPVLNRFWGTRQRWMHLTWTVSFLLVTAFLYLTRLPPTGVFPILVSLAVAAGVVDILLFLGVHEPENVRTTGRGPLEVLLAPFRHTDYRYFILFSCFWSFATMFAAAFMQLYVLKELAAPAWKTTLIWCLQGTGVALVARRWGRIADRHGHRPVLRLTVLCKSAIVVVFLLLTPRNLMAVLPVAFMLDGMLNSGFMVAANGYMLTIAPRENRSMFVAAIRGLSGIAGGLSAMAAGVLLRHLEGVTLAWHGHPVNRYQVVFAVSLLLRLVAIPLVRTVREPKASRSLTVLNDLFGQFPLRFLRFPVGLYRR